MVSRFLLLLTIFFSSIHFSLSQSRVYELHPKREFRGVWVATVANIDWPSRPGLSTERQKAELIHILDEHQRNGINAIMLQVRPAADAFYGKGREPWSRFITGKQGREPSPYYDPLEFAITEAHKRGMELHAWFNPYRATTTLSPVDVSPTHITKSRPEWFFTYGGKKLFNPGIPEVREYIIQVIMDVVKNYDIDGIHFDDYFYPYPERNMTLPDRETFARYGKEFDNIDDWRRHNVDTLIHCVADSIHSVKKYVKFGVSPFGIWRNQSQDPDGSDSRGLDSYASIFADSRKWISSGWLDYINPQIYFPFYNRAAAYEKLVDWWSNNTYGRHLYIGHAAYRAIERKGGWTDWQQLPNQIRYARENSRVQGSVFFSSKSVTSNFAGLEDSLRANFYKYPALPPQMLWLDGIPPQSPLNLRVNGTGNKLTLNWETPMRARDGETAYGYVIYRFDAGENIDIQNATKIRKISYDTSTSFIDQDIPTGAYIYVVTALDRLKNESLPSNQVMISVPPINQASAVQ